jgi:DNA repair protein RadC
VPFAPRRADERRRQRLPEAPALVEPAPRRVEARALDVGVVDDATLLAGLLGSTREVALELLAKAGSLPRLARFSIDDLMELVGVSRADAVKIAAACELGRRSLLVEARPLGPQLGSAALARWFKLRIGAAFVQEIWVAGLDDGGSLRAVCRVSRGDVHGGALAASDVIGVAKRMRVRTIVLAHNHPSGSIAVTPHDLALVVRIRRAALAAGIELGDVLIVGPTAGYTSLLEQGLLPGRT